jgi:deoxyribose-phosphate aldolase
MKLNGAQLARMIDSTDVATLATKQNVDEMISQAKEFHFYAINAPASYFPYLVENLRGSDTNPGFGCCRWSGADPTLIKAACAKWAVDLGAKEIDMVMNLSYFKSGMYDEVVRDIGEVKDAIGKEHPLKVIVECPLQSDEEIVKAVELVISAGAECVKSASGMEGPTTIHHVEVLTKAAKGRVWIKAAGGIRTIETVDRMLDLGVARFGVNYHSAKALCLAADQR